MTSMINTNPFFDVIDVQVRTCRGPSRDLVLLHCVLGQCGSDVPMEHAILHVSVHEQRAQNTETFLATNHGPIETRPER